MGSGLSRKVRAREGIGRIKSAFVGGGGATIRLARDSNTAVCQSKRSEAIASRLAPTEAEQGWFSTNAALPFNFATLTLI